MSTKPRGRLILSIPNSLNLLVCCFSIFRTGRGKDKCLKVNAIYSLAQPGDNIQVSPLLLGTPPQAGKRSSLIYKTIPRTLTVTLRIVNLLPSPHLLAQIPRSCQPAVGRRRHFSGEQSWPAPQHQHLTLESAQDHLCLPKARPGGQSHSFR